MARKAQQTIGTVYLIHFAQPYRARTGKQKHQVTHYIGWAQDLEARINEHRENRGARLLEVVNEAGIDWQVVQTWPGDRKLERKLKNRKKSRCLCPICRQSAKDAKAQLLLFH